jgi:hypothetical protein
MRGVGEVCGMGSFRPRRAGKAEFESAIESGPENVGPEGNTGLFNEQMPEAALAQVGSTMTSSLAPAS